MEIFLFFLSGLVSGLLAGLLGIGGGLISVPVLYYLLPHLGLSSTHLMQIAVSTSLASTVLTATVSSWSHVRKKGILFALSKYLFPPLIVGSAAGAFIAHSISSDFLLYCFAIASLLIGAFLFFAPTPLPLLANRPNWSLSLFVAIIGLLSSLLGVGGGIFMVPLLLSYHLSWKESIGTASATTLASAIFGTIFYLYFDTSQPTPSTFHSIYLPAFFLISLASFCTAPLGVKWAHSLPTPQLKRIFGALVFLIGWVMVLTK